MKHLPLYTSAYQNLLLDFGRYLERIGYAKGTRQTMPAHLQEFFYWLESEGINRLAEVTPQLIQAHHQYLQQRPNQRGAGNLSASQVESHLYAIRTFFNYQQTLGHLPANPCSVLSFPKQSYQARAILSVEEVKLLYGACETLRDRALLGIFYGCGLRRSEAVLLNTSDIHLRSSLLYVRLGKGKKRRAVPLSSQVQYDFENYYYKERSAYLKPVSKRKVQEGEQAFILSNKGGRMDGQAYHKRLKYLVGQSPLPAKVSLHHLRHSIATHLLEGGLSLEQVRDFLGHTNLYTTQLYTRISPQYLSTLSQ